MKMKDIEEIEKQLICRYYCFSLGIEDYLRGIYASPDTIHNVLKYPDEYDKGFNIAEEKARDFLNDNDLVNDMNNIRENKDILGNLWFGK